jgi:gliding motility-associated-like protein
MILLMRLGFPHVFMLALFSISRISLHAQQSPTYIVNGDAITLSCNCYQLTPDINWRGGSVWNKNKIDLKNSFNYIFNVYLGTKDSDGADGIVFILQQVGTSIGAQGQGLGFLGISPSIGIPIDTYQNFDYNDPSYDHIGILKNGDLVYGTPNTLAGPVPAIADNPNIEDGKWHTLRVIWDAGTQVLSAEVDGVPRVQAKVDLVKDVFNNASEVYWGFSGATGGLNNIEKFCTSLNAAFTIPPGSSCAPAIVQFNDNSTSFGTIVQWSWDFGDNTSFMGQRPAPHAYSTPGNYMIKMTIEANNGCISDTLFKKIVIGSIPEVSFSSSPPVICADNEALLTSTAILQFGTINEWDWNINNGAEEIQATDSFIRKTFPAGNTQIQLIVKTVEGCVSEPFTKTVDITPKPTISLAVQDACYGDPVPLVSGNQTPGITMRQWYWNTGDGMVDSSESIKHFYPGGGEYTVSVYALNYAGCSSDTSTAMLTIHQSNAKVGNDTIVAFGQPLQLNATGGEFYQWTPANGLNDPAIANPVAILYDSIRYILQATTSFGCPTYDTIFIKAYKGPDIYVPNAFTPNHDGRNDYFHPIIVGMSRIENFEIFNRDGQKVFSSQGGLPGWDGNLNGKPQPVGTYVWMIKGQDYLGNFHSEKGTVVLIR